MLLTAVLSVCPGMVPLLLLDPPDDAAICKSPEILARMADGQAPEGAVAGNGHTTDVLHYDLDLEIVPADTWLGGSNAILARSLVDDLTVFPIRLHDAFDITAVTSGGIPATWQRISPETIEVQLDRAYQTDETFEVSIAYDGNPQPGGFGSINFQSEGGLPLVYTLSEPWYAYTWWPAKDDNTDKATGDLSFTAPDELTVASNGALLSVEDLGDGRKVHHWSTGYQTATYLFSFSAAGYNTFSETFVHDQGTMPVEFFIFPGSDNQSNRDGWAESVAMLDVFTDLFGPYPFLDEKYGIYEFGFGGGMEHQTMTGQGGFGESLTAHELAHQWWGDMITCATWQDIWLNEGFATYGEALWKEFKNGSSNPTALHAHMASRRPNNVNGSVWIPADEATSINRIFSGNYSYRKAAWVLHQLRHVVGDAAFFDTLATYRQTFEYDAALTAEFIAVAEAIHGADLDWFFDPWLYGLGAPEYESAWEIYELDGTTWLEIYVKQVQSGSYPIFPMPLDVRLTGPVLNETRVIWNDEPAEHFLLEVPDGVGAMVLDPNDWTLHTSNETTAFVEGPPRVVDTSPAPGEAIEWTAGGLILVSFHKDVLAGEQDFILVGDNTGEIGVNMSFNGSMSVVELLPAMSLAPDDYTLTVKDTVIDVAGELELDGELLDAIDPGSLPSGEGLPGGDAILRFTVLAPPIDADVNDDGVVDVSDLVAVILAWGPCPSPPAECPADVNGDGEVSVADLVEVVLAWN